MGDSKLIVSEIIKLALQGESIENIKEKLSIENKDWNRFSGMAYSEYLAIEKKDELNS